MLSDVGVGGRRQELMILPPSNDRAISTNRSDLVLALLCPATGLQIRT